MINGTEQYQKAKEYRGPESRLALCKASIVQPVTEMMIGETQHAGLVTHRCSLPWNHEGDCECGPGCAYRFKKNFK